MLLDIADELRRVMALRITVRIFAVRQQHHLHVEACFQEHVDTSQRRMDTGSVSVVQHGDITREPFDQPYLRLGQSRTSTCYHVLDTRLIHRDNVQLSLHQVTHIGP